MSRHVVPRIVQMTTTSLPLNEAKDHISDFAFSVRSANEGRALNYPSGISEINVVIAQICFIFLIIPLERTDVGEQFSILIG